jgi:hypothetical protein
MTDKDMNIGHGKASDKEAEGAAMAPSRPKEIRGNPKQPKVAEKYRVVLTWGNVWADMFEQSLARKMAAITHIGMGPRFKLNQSLFTQLMQPEWHLPERAKQETWARLTGNNRQASELLFRFKWYVQHSTHVFLDNSVLDTAIGHQLLLNAAESKLPTWAIALDDRLSPLAPAYLHGVLYPSTPDDLVNLVVRTESPKQLPEPEREMEPLPPGSPEMDSQKSENV